MACRLGRLAGFVSAVVITGCASESQPVPPAPPAITIPDLRGTWSGTWGGTPLTLLVIEQHETGAYSGFYLGSVPLLGQRVPNVNGVMTSTIRGDAVSISIEGWFGYANAGLILLVKGATSDGTQQLMLTRVDPERLAGTGESSFRWGPRGSVELTRRSAGPAASSFPAAGTFSRLIGVRQ